MFHGFFKWVSEIEQILDSILRIDKINDLLKYYEKTIPLSIVFVNTLLELYACIIMLNDENDRLRKLMSKINNSFVCISDYIYRRHVQQKLCFQDRLVASQAIKRNRTQSQPALDRHEWQSKALILVIQAF
jgi:hypothetical protein